MDLSNKVAIVTGASRGIGKAIALAFAREGADVIVNYFSTEKAAEQVVKEIEQLGPKAMAIQADVASMRDVQQLLARALEEFGKVDILVNNAGIILRAAGWMNLSEENWNRMIDVNLKGVFNCIRVVSQHMLERKQGKIVNISSTYGIIGSAPVIAYAAAKAGVVTITHSFAKELAPYINVNAVAPGNIDTDMTRGAGQQFIDSIVAKTPLKRLGRPDDVASAVVFLSSSKADFITGHVLVVDGGHIL